MISGSYRVSIILNKDFEKSYNLNKSLNIKQIS